MFFWWFCGCSFFTCCPIISANLRDTAPMLLILIPLSLPSATSKMHSALWPCCQRSTVGGLPSKSRHCTASKSRVQWCLFWFNICRTPPTIPPTDDNVSFITPPTIPPTDDNVNFITESEWVGFPSRADHHHIHPSIFLCRLSDIEGFHQKCLRQGMKQVHWDWAHNNSMVWRAKEAEKKWMKLRCMVPAYPLGPDW